MDTRKQKRLGAAPIASFEKSLEDATSNTTATKLNMGVTMPMSVGTAATLNQSSMHQNSNKAVKQEILRNGREAKAQNNHTMETARSTAAVVSSSEMATAKVTETPHDIKLSEGGKRAPTMNAVANDSNQQLYKGFSTLTTPQTPRIELSRASSSSIKEEDSRESSPDNVFEQVGTGTLQEAIGSGFREDGALDLRSSTEELFFMDPAHKKAEQEKLQQQQQAKGSSPHIFKFEDHQMYLQQHQRKDSASSEVAALLCISGRTSRISSVGSQGSAVSRLSAVSGVSRSPSPHRMLLETSFCGPKPLENTVDGRMPSSVEPQIVEQLEQMLLRRKQDPTQAVLAEGIKIEGSPKKSSTLSNGSFRNVTQPEEKSHSIKTKSSVIGAQRSSTKSPGQMVVGKTPSGTEYIRINLKPDHMYADKGIAPNERVVDAPNTLTPVYATTQKKPGSLSLGRNKLDENLLTPTASPKLGRRSPKELRCSRSPSPAAVSVSRKSSFSSLFRFGSGGKDSPDSHTERPRSRSKSKDHLVSHSQNATPSKQKSVLAIFKTNGKRGSAPGIELKSSSKTCSPIDSQPDQNLRSKSQTPVAPGSASTSRPGSRLRYYDEPVEGIIHIPLHTPPEERETRELLQGIQKLNSESIRAIPAPITASQLAAAAAALKPVGARKNSNDKCKLEDIEVIQTLTQEEDSKLRIGSLVKQKLSSQDSQDTLASESSYAHAIRLGLRLNNQNLPNVKEQDMQQENKIAAEAPASIHRLPSQDSNTSVCEKQIIETVATVNTCTIASPVLNIKEDTVSAKEKRRLLFATRLGSGSQDQVFSTQFSISKTESLSSQLSEKGQDTIFGSPESEVLHRQATIIRRSEEDKSGLLQSKCSTDSVGQNFGTIKRQAKPEMKTGRQTSISTSEDERYIGATKTITTAVVLRRKDSSDEQYRKSHSTSEDDGMEMTNQRHSRYLENFDVRKKYHENLSRKPKRQSVMETKDSFEIQKSSKPSPVIPHPPPPLTAPTPSSPAPIDSRTSTPTATAKEPRSQSQSPVERRQTPTKPPRSNTPTRRSQGTTPTSPSPVQCVSTAVHGTKRSSQPTDKQLVQQSTDEPIESSESERDFAGSKISEASEHKRRHHCHVAPIEDHESTGLVSQESFDDELPYIPTTLPEERAHGVSLIPMKERANMELKTCPVERPRSTTPLNPSHLEEFGIATPQEVPYESLSSTPVRGEKLRISLPRRDPNKEKAPTARSPRHSSNTSGKSWFEFAEEGLRATNTANLERKDSSKRILDQKPSSSAATSKTVIVAQKALAGKSTQRKLSGHWIDFENIPEKRKPPKRITALPKETTGTNTKITQVKHQQAQPDLTSGSTHTDDKFHYNYVKPEDCQCECHEHGRGPDTFDHGESKVASVDLLAQGEDLLPLLDTDGHEAVEQSHLSDSSREFSYYTDDEDNIPERRRVKSRRSHSAAKGEFPRREYTPSARAKKFPDNRN